MSTDNQNGKENDFTELSSEQKAKLDDFAEKITTEKGGEPDTTSDSGQHITGNQAIDSILNDVKSRTEQPVEDHSVEGPEDNNEKASNVQVGDAEYSSQEQGPEEWSLEEVPLEQYAHYDHDDLQSPATQDIAYESGGSEASTQTEISMEHHDGQSYEKPVDAKEISPDDVNPDSEHIDSEPSQEVILDDGGYEQEFNEAKAEELPQEEPVFDPQEFESDFAVHVDEQGVVNDESISSEPHVDDLALNSHQHASTNPASHLNAQPTYQNYPQNPPAAYGYAKKPLFGSLGSLFNKEKQIESAPSFEKYLEQSASLDLQRLSKLHYEHVDLMHQVIDLSKPENYSPSNEEKVAELIGKLSKSADVIDSQTDRLSVTTSSMPKQKELLGEQSESFTSVSKDLKDRLDENVEKLESDKIKSAMESLSKALKQLFDKLVTMGRAQHSSEPLMSN